MKRLLMIVTFIVISIGMFSQTPISYTQANKYKVKETEDKWDSEWTNVENGKIYIYLDMGFDFASITNQNFDRFILTGMEEPVQHTDKSVTTMYAIDDVGVNCELHISLYKNNDATLTIIYSNMQYQYLMGETHQGFPDEYFGTSTVEDEPKNKIGEKQPKTYNL